MESRIEKSVALHKDGYNCAQAVACAYCDLLGTDLETAYRAAEGFGAGMGMTEVCGAISGAAILAGFKNSGGSDQAGATKGETTRMVREIGQAFAQSNGSILCRELKGMTGSAPLRSCPDCIRDAAVLVEKVLLK